MAAHHERCEKLCRDHADGCNNDDAHKAIFHALSDEHKAMGGHHTIAIAQFEAEPEIVDLTPGKTIGTFFGKGQIEADLNQLPIDIRKLIQSE
jgi:hypothetical protein